MTKLDAYFIGTCVCIAQLNTDTCIFMSIVLFMCAVPEFIKVLK